MVTLSHLELPHAIIHNYLITKYHVITEVYFYALYKNTLPKSSNQNSPMHVCVCVWCVKEIQNILDGIKGGAL